MDNSDSTNPSFFNKKFLSAQGIFRANSNKQNKIINEIIKSLPENTETCDCLTTPCRCNMTDDPASWRCHSIRNTVKWQCQKCNKPCRKHGEPFDTHERTLVVTDYLVAGPTLGHSPISTGFYFNWALCGICFLKYQVIHNNWRILLFFLWILVCLSIICFRLYFVPTLVSPNDYDPSRHAVVSEHEETTSDRYSENTTSYVDEWKDMKTGKTYSSADPDIKMARIKKRRTISLFYIIVGHLLLTFHTFKLAAHLKAVGSSEIWKMCKKYFLPKSIIILTFIGFLHNL